LLVRGRSLWLAVRFPCTGVVKEKQEMPTKTVVVLSLLSCTLSPMLLGCARSSEGRPVRADEPSAPIKRKVAILPFKNLTPSE